VTFDITVKEVGEPVLPEVDADFAKALGIEDGDLVKMRAEIEENLKREVKKRLQAQDHGSGDGCAARRPTRSRCRAH
jgi:trigger factor